MVNGFICASFNFLRNKFFSVFFFFFGWQCILSALIQIVKSMLFPLWITVFFFFLSTATSVCWVWQLSSAAFKTLSVVHFSVYLSVCVRESEWDLCLYSSKCISILWMYVYRTIKLWVRLWRTPIQHSLCVLLRKVLRTVEDTHTYTSTIFGENQTRK